MERTNLMKTMRNSAEETALSTFIDAATSDEDLGYPNGAAFVAWGDDPQTGRVVWRYLHEGRAAVIVGSNDLELLLEPIRVGPLDRLRNEFTRRITVQVSYRHKETPDVPAMPPVRADIGRHALDSALTPAIV
jgi:hypothetical protein